MQQENYNELVLPKNWSFKMKVCVFGAGAIGGFISAKLALSGCNVTLIARGRNLNAIKQNLLL